MSEFNNSNEELVTIAIVGVGGGGSNAINRMIKMYSGKVCKDVGQGNSSYIPKENLKGIHFFAVNTDQQALRKSLAEKKIVIGEKFTKGRGAGGDPKKGKRAAEENREEIAEALQGVQMVFITAGMGGGTGTGAAPVVASEAKKAGILTVAIVTKPFEFEGQDRMNQAEEGILELRQNVDVLLIIPNDRLMLLPDNELTLFNAFKYADTILIQGITCISKIVVTTGEINLDFADLAAVMTDAGDAHMGVGKGTGRNKAKQAVESAITSPLLESSIEGAQAVIVNFDVSPDISLADVSSANLEIKSAVHPNVKIFWGVTFNENAKDEVEITVIATKFDLSNSGKKGIFTKSAAAKKMLNEINSLNETSDDSVEYLRKIISDKDNKFANSNEEDDDDFFVHLTSKLKSYNLDFNNDENKE